MGNNVAICVCPCGAECAYSATTKPCAYCGKTNENKCWFGKCKSCGKLVCGMCAESYFYDADKVFAQGACRYAYKASHSRGKEYFDDVIIKKFIGHTAYNKNDWNGDIKCYKKSIELINEYNKLDLINKKYIMYEPKLFENGIYEGDRFDDMKLPPELSHFRSNHNNQHAAKPNEYVLIETLLKGDYEKWNCNSGWVSNQKLSVQAFCHWTYHYSKGKILLCDAQGVRGEKNYYITDPAILSVDGSYGMTDTGGEGIEQWFGCHECNAFCDKKWIKPAKMGKKSLRVTKHSIYRWQTGFK
eukprot:220602_1